MCLFQGQRIWLSFIGLGFSAQLFAGVIDEKRSLVSIVTYKEGIASSLAHNHFIVAPQVTIEGSIDLKAIEAGSLTISFPVSSLEVDAPENYETWQSFLTEENLLTEPSKISSSDRKDITANMLAADQLNAVVFPIISGTLSQLTRKSETVWDGKLVLDIHGEKVSRNVTLKVDGVAAVIDESYQFTDFKITPYSAMLGAIRVKNDFRLAVKLVFSAQVNDSKGDKP